MDEFLYLIHMLFAQRGIDISKEQEEKLAKYGEFLLEYNEKVNLTAVTDKEAVVRLHFLDSLSALELPQLIKGATCADIGTGAGFPGVPLAIMRPDINVLLVDSLNKRLVFLEELKVLLKIDNINTFHSRGEDMGKMPQYRERFDCVFSRAVAKLNTLCELDLPLVKQGGYMLAWKGPGIKEELPEAESAISILGGKIDRLYMSERDNETLHSIAVIKKVKQTPQAYPRQAGMPKRKPL